MKLEDQVASLDLCKKLKKFGVKQNSVFSWQKNGDLLYPRDPNRNPYADFSAFSVAELGQLCGIHLGEFRPQFGDETEADYRAKMLIYLIEKGLVKL